MTRPAVLIACALALGVAIWLSPGQQQADIQTATDQEQPTIGTVVGPNQNAIPTQPSNESQPTPANQQARSQTQSSGWITKENLPDWLTIVLGLIGAYVAYRQFKQAEDAVLKTQKAHVLLEGMHISPKVNPLLPESNVIFQVKNYGPTPASDVTFTTFRLRIEGEPDHPDVPLPVSVIPAGDFISAAFVRLNGLFKPEAIALASTGKKKLTFEVAFTYKDVFGQTHSSVSSGTYDGSGRAGGFIVVVNKDGSQQNG